MKRPERIVRGQRVVREKLARAKELRCEMTPQEARLWERVRNNGLAGLHFRRQQVVDGFILDFYCHRAAVVVELDGPIHLQQAVQDEERSRWLQARGLHVIRIANDEVEADIEKVLALIAATCHAQLSSTR